MQKRCCRLPSMTMRLALLSVLSAGTVLGAGEAPAAEAWPRSVEGHQAVEAGAHPRLIVRAGEGLEAVRAKAGTPWGEKVVARVEQAIRVIDKLAVTGRNREVLKEAGFKAAGYGAVYLLRDDAEAAKTARQIVLDEIVAYPMIGSLPAMDRCSRLHGAALAYDLCYDAWSEYTRKKVRKFLLAEAGNLLKKVGGTEAKNPDQPEHVAVCATAGLVVLATQGDGEDGNAPSFGACERAVIRYLEEEIGEHGFSRNGESPRQTAFASGVLPFARANRLVRGRDLTAHPAVQAVMDPMVYQTVPDVGMAVTGDRTAAVDRTGLFAMATDLLPEAKRPAIRWLFEQLDGERYLGIVRPHQGLYMLLSGLEDVSAEAPAGDRWPPFVRSDRANFVVLRSAWHDSDDLAMVLHGADLRLLGLGAQWAAQPCQHAGIWSHNPGAGRLGNVFLPDTHVGKNRVYRLQADSKLGESADGKDGETMSVTVVTSGKVERVREKMRTEKRKNGKKVQETSEVAKGGPFEVRRVFGADYSGQCGAPGLFAIADRLKGGGGAPNVWVLHTGHKVSIETNGNEFRLKGPDAVLVGTVLVPDEVKIGASSNPPYTNFLSIETDNDRVDVIMTVQKGKAPEVKAGKDGLNGKVRVGKRTVTLKDGRMRFGE